MGGYIGKGQGVVLVDGYTRSEVDTAIANADEVTKSASQPASAVQGDLWYDTSIDILKAYDGTNWNKVSPVIPAITSITGSILETIGGTLAIGGTGFLSQSCTVAFSATGVSTQNVTVTASSDTSISVTVPSAIYNLSAGTVVSVSVINSDNGQSPASTFNIVGVPTGGTVSTTGNYRVHTFTSSSNFVVPSGLSLSNVEYLIIAGGGGGGANRGGGAGAGGYRSSVVGENSGGGASAESRISLTPGTYGVVVGAGGAASGTGNADDGGQGNNSIFNSITSLGGGLGRSDDENGAAGGSGAGSGGGAWGGSGGAGTSGQGYAGGSGSAANNYGNSACGGGGAGGAGVTATGSQWGAGGAGVSSSITGSSVTRASGGGGGSGNASSQGATPGGGGKGADTNDSSTANYGQANTGGGGGGGSNGGSSLAGGQGGSGIVIIRYEL